MNLQGETLAKAESWQTTLANAKPANRKDTPHFDKKVGIANGKMNEVKGLEGKRRLLANGFYTMVEKAYKSLR